MQDSIRKILVKLNDHNPLQYRRNKENRYFNRLSNQDPSFTQDDIHKLSKRVQRLQLTIDSLITDANTVVRYYQELLKDSVEKNQQLRQDFAACRATSDIDKNQADKQISDLTKQIQSLHQQLNRKTIAYHDLLQKYEQFEEDNSEVRHQTEGQILKLKESINKETLEFEQKIAIQQIRIETLEEEKQQLEKNNEQIRQENEYLQKINKELQNDLNFFQEQLHLEQSNRKVCSLSEKQNISEEEPIPIEGEDVEYTFQQIKMNFSHQQSNMNLPKEVLDISQHYSKYNRTEQMLSKEKICSLLEMNSNESKPFKSSRNIDITDSKKIKSKENSQSLYMKIGTLQSKDELPNSYTNDSKNNQKIQEFKMVQVNYEEDPPINPYQAFFSLMVQCQKMNSSSFNNICDLKVDYLYDKFVEEGLPYNQWQKEINKVLKSNSRNIK